MAAEALQVQATPAISSAKHLSETPNLHSIPSNYTFFTDPSATAAAEAGDSVPIIDISALASHDFQRRSEALHDLDKACREWGFFMVVNHGIPEQLMKSVIDVSNEFFNLSDEEKPEFQPKNVLEPIRYGTSFNTATEEIFCWRDFLKMIVHPEFHCPDEPASLREIAREYCGRSRGVVRELAKAICKNLALEPDEMEETLDLASSFQVFVANYYPRCPRPDAALGMAPHSDHGLLTLLISNGVGGLQIQHAGGWVNVDALPGSILVNAGDHLEIFSNGKYSSVLHRAVVNDNTTRISVAVANGPSRETIVRPAEKLVDGYPLYSPMKYGEYILSQQSNPLRGKSVLQQLKIQEQSSPALLDA